MRREVDEKLSRIRVFPDLHAIYDKGPIDLKEPGLYLVSDKILRNAVP